MARTSLHKRSGLAKLTLAILFLCFNYSILAQEICDNGIDDDGDEFVDLEDAEDCSCGDVVLSGIAGDFEEYSCCPMTFTSLPGTGIHCMEGSWEFSP